MSDIILEAKGLCFSYDEEQEYSLYDISLQIKRGQKVAFMGANGSGKSTFFLCCNGIHKPDKGALYFNGKPVDYSKKGLLNLRSKVGIVFQDPDDQLFSASVRQEISFGILNLGVSKEQAEEEVEHIIGQLGITPFMERPTHSLSGGQKKQVSIADILVMHPDLIILDEPAAALDPKHAKIVNQTVDQLTKEGMTVLMATHDIDHAFGWADEIVLMHKGRVLLKGDPVTVCSDKRALQMTNLEEPAVLRLYESLCRKGVLDEELEVPKNLEILESYIENIPVKGGNYGNKESNSGGKFWHQPSGYDAKNHRSN